MGWLGFVLIGGGALAVWAGFEGVNILDVARAVLTGQPVPRATGQGGTPPATTPPSGVSGASGFDPKTKDPDGVGGGSGGTW